MDRDLFYLETCMDRDLSLKSYDIDFSFYVKMKPVFSWVRVDMVVRKKTNELSSIS